MEGNFCTEQFIQIKIYQLKFRDDENFKRYYLITRIFYILISLIIIISSLFIISSITEKIKLEIASADDNKRIELQADMQKKYQELTNAVSKNNNDENIATLMIQLEGSYNRISVEGKRYNDAVKKYNVLVKKHGSDFPEFKIKSYFKGQ